MKTVVLRRFRQLVLGLYVASVVGCAAMVIGPALNDYYINQNPGRALARVSAIGPTRTAVEFIDTTGAVVSPKRGVLYPSGLAVGQRVWVAYDVTNPERAKIDGREWTLSIIPALSALVVVTGLFGLVWAWLWWMTQRQQ